MVSGFMVMIFGKRSLNGILFHFLRIYWYNFFSFPMIYGYVVMPFRKFSRFMGGSSCLIPNNCVQLTSSNEPLMRARIHCLNLSSHKSRTHTCSN